MGAYPHPGGVLWQFDSPHRGYLRPKRPHLHFPWDGDTFCELGGKIFGNLSGRGWYGWGWSRNFEKRGYLSLEVRIDNSHQHKGGFMYDIQAFKERLG